MTQLHEVLAQIAAFAQQLPSADAGALKEKLQQATAYLNGHAGNLQSPGLSEAIAMLANAEQQQSEVQGKIEGARERIIEVLNALGLGFTGSGAVIMHPAVRASSGKQSPVSAAPRRSFKDQAPEHLKRLGLDRKEFLSAALTPSRISQLLAGLPRMTPGAGQKTRGFWIDGNGHPQEIASGKHDVEYEAAHQYWRVIAEHVFEQNQDQFQKLKMTNWQSAWEGIRTASHVEIKAVIAMRATGKSHGTIVINNPNGPCAGTPITCDELLGHYLRKGQTMTIYWPEGRHQVVRGKG